MRDRKGDSLGRRTRRRLKVTSVPLDSEELAADVPQSPRRLLAPALGDHEGGGAVTEIKEEAAIVT